MPKNQAFDPIAFLVDARFPEKPSPFYYEDNLGWSLEKRRRILNEIASYEKHLASLSPKQVEDLVWDERERRAAAEDAELPFSEPLSADDIAHWGCLASWSLLEAVALSLGKDPLKVDQESLTAAAEVSPLAKRYNRLKDRVLRAEQTGELSNPISPPKYIEWAQREAICLPNDIEVAVGLRFGRLEDDRSIRDANTQLIRRIGQLEALLSAQGMVNTQTPSDHPLRARERDSLLLIMIACAINPYNYRPEVRSDVPKRISQQLERWGMPLSDDTVRNHLTKAAELLPGNWKERWNKNDGQSLVASQLVP